MNRLKHFQWLGAVALALLITIAPTITSAQESDTLVISGTFTLNTRVGSVGADLAEVYAKGDEHDWTLTLHGVTSSNDFEVTELEDEFLYQYSEAHVTRVHATTFDFEFDGPDANILNAVVAQQLAKRSLSGEALLELQNVYYCIADVTGFTYEGRAGAWSVGLRPEDPATGVSFLVTGVGNPFSADESGYPLVKPQRLRAYNTHIVDSRPGNDGALQLAERLHYVDIGTSASPPPPVLPTLSILDGSVREGNRGSTSLNLTVTLSKSSSGPVTVDYRTSNGTALANKDYYASHSTLTFPAGQTQRSLTILIRPDRKREPNETFTVTLSNAVGATIADATATATILNDD